MNTSLTPKFKKGYDKLPQALKKKTKKAINFLRQDLFYPSLNTKKMGGADLWEARVDKHYRLTFSKTEDTITLLTGGPHDDGLGKK